MFGTVQSGPQKVPAAHAGSSHVPAVYLSFPIYYGSGPGPEGKMSNFIPSFHKISLCVPIISNSLARCALFSEGGGGGGGVGDKGRLVTRSQTTILQFGKKKQSKQKSKRKPAKRTEVKSSQRRPVTIQIINNLFSSISVYSRFTIKDSQNGFSVDGKTKGGSRGHVKTAARETGGIAAYIYVNCFTFFISF